MWVAKFDFCGIYMVTFLMVVLQLHGSSLIFVKPKANRLAVITSYVYLCGLGTEFAALF